MLAETLSFRRYRNLKDDQISFSDGVNILTGMNAQGKTNILEAVWFFSSCRSFRGSEDRDFIRNGENGCDITLQYKRNGRSCEAKALISEEKRRILYHNDVKVRPSELIGNFSTVLFYPEQLFLVKGAPEQRRKFLDFAIAQLSPRYIEALARYSRLLLQKNRILRDAEPSLLDTLSQWNAEIAKCSAYVTYLRKEYIDRILPSVTQVGTEISEGKEKLGLDFLPSGIHEEEKPSSLSEWESAISESLERHLTAEIAAGHSLVGCNRDDFSITVNGLSAKSFASQGQQRSCVIALKCAEADLLAEKVGEYPVMLFDDVFSELDSSRKKYMINKILGKQVIVTCCEPVEGLTDGEAKVFTVDDGKICVLGQ